MKRFQDLRIVEITGSAAGSYASKLFADYGASVFRIEPREGAPDLHEGEDWHGIGTTYAYLNTSKRRLQLDLHDEPARRQLDKLLAAADVLIESSSPDPLTLVTTPGISQGGHQHLVRTQISPFGSFGPYSQFRSNSFTDDAIGGHLYVNGERDREPIRRPGLHSLFQAGVHAYIGTIAALWARDRKTRGQTVEVAHLDGLASLHQHTTTMWTQAGHIIQRVGNRQPGPWHPVGCYPCKDGYVHLALASGVKLADFLAAAGIGHLLDDPRFGDDHQRGAHKDEFDEALIPWLMEHTVDEIVEIGQSVFAPVGRVPTMLELLNDPHLAARDYWCSIEGESTLQLPRGPFHISGLEPNPTSSRRSDASEGWADTPDLAEPASHDKPTTHGPLTGVRILDLTRVWAGPLAGRLLADLGADVVLIEAPFSRGPAEVAAAAGPLTHLYPEEEVGEQPWNRLGGFNKLARNRRSVSLDLSNPAGRQVFADLVRQADVVMENYSPRVMPQFGFDFEGLRKINPNIVYAAMPGYGATGPDRNRTALGPLIEAGSGLSASMGYSDSGPYRSGIAWPDPVAGMHSAAAILTALADREADPDRAGRAIEVAMIEAMGCFVGESLLAAQVRGSDTAPCGNHDPQRAPQGCYPCAGHDRWIAISVETDEQWTVLARIAALDDLASLTLDERTVRRDELDVRIAAWTRSSDPNTLMHTLQQAGVIAMLVADARDIVESPQLAARNFWAVLNHPVVGLRSYPGNPIRLSDTPITYRSSAPLLGQHNRAVLTEWLNYSTGRLETLERDAILANRPPPDRTRAPRTSEFASCLADHSPTVRRTR
jgi:crotonobetainyl-CoA:carnitine CoA-transferase CaiB-like acyl-CoA transferase